MDTPRCNSPGHTWMACTHMEALYGGHTCKPWIHLEWTHLEWTHLDDMYPPGWFKIIGYTWKVWTHQEALNTGAMEPLMDSSRQLPWISMTHDLTDKDVFWKWSSWQEHWLKDQCRYPILLHWRMWSPGTPGHGVIFCYPVPLGPLLTEDPVILDPPVRRRQRHSNLYCCYGSSTPFLNQWHSWWPGVCIRWSHQEPYGQWVNTLRPRQYGRHFADDIFKCIFLNENIWISIKISLKFVPKGPINNIPALVQIMAWRRPGDKPLSEPMMV